MPQSDKRLDPEAWGASFQSPSIVGNAILPLYNQNRNSMVSTLRFGDAVTLYAEDEDWTLLAAVDDGYLGWAKAFKAGHEGNDRKRVSNLATHIYQNANIKEPPIERLSLGAWLDIEGEDKEFYKTPQGFIFKTHFSPHFDAIEYAAQFLNTPYLWGGGSCDGIDCSGLVQLCYSMTGVALPRDSDQQENALQEVKRDEIKRGDLVFWKGHVGLIETPETMIHATAFAMKTIREDLEHAIARIGEPTSFRRVKEHEKVFMGEEQP